MTFSLTRHAPALLLALLATPATAAPDEPIGPGPLTLLPGLTPRGDQRVAPGDIVASAFLGRPDAAFLMDTISVDRGGIQRVQPRETVLAAATVAGLPADTAVFCEAESSTPLPARLCVYDSDADRRLDKALLVAPAGAAPRKPFAIPPVAFALMRGEPLGNGSEVRLRYAGPAGRGDSVAFDLEVTMFGSPRQLRRSRYVVPTPRLPAHEIVLDAVLTVSAVDRVSRVATVRMNRDLAPGYLALSILQPFGDRPPPPAR